MVNFDAMKVKNDCVKWIKDWFAANGKGCNAVIGISGGKDSTVVAALCVEALGKDRVIGVLMPSYIQSDIDDAYNLCEHLGIRYIVCNIGRAVDSVLNSMHFGMNHNSTMEFFEITNQTRINLPPRIRMATLYAVSQSVNGRVANTCNWSEDYIGYSTRWGDAVGDFSPLGNLTSDEVIAIGDVCNLPYELTHKTPSDGLCGKTDEDNFGFSYATLNKYIRTGICENEEVRVRIDQMHTKNLFKLMPIPTFKYEV